METIKFVYYQENDLWVGWLDEYPDYRTQGATLEELKENITQMGLDFDIYLKNIKKTTEELKKEWRPRAQERVRAALILQEIAKNEMVDVSIQEIDNEINKILLEYPDAESVKKQIDIERLKEYTKGRLKNEKVFELLESL